MNSPRYAQATCTGARRRWYRWLILKGRGLDLTKKIKFARHQGDKGLIPRVLELGLLDGA